MHDVSQNNRGAVLTIAFGTTTAMWAVGYLTHLPGLRIASSVVFAAMFACMLMGGVLAGMFAQRPLRTGLLSGLGLGILNLMILGSLLAQDSTNAVYPSAPIYILGFILGCTLVITLCAFIGMKISRHAPRQENWTALFARVAVAATLLLVTVGGFVTSKEAGLAVVDWPNSFGYNMFLYPLSRMTGGIYYEHTHRLIGSLVGLTVLALTIHLWMTDSRRWLKVFASATLLAVIVQGILGGLRVTGYFTWSQDPHDTAPNIILAIVHGIFGQTIFGAIVAIAVFTTTTFRSPRAVERNLSASTDRTLSIVLIVVLISQLIVGAMLRHIVYGLTLHVTLAIGALAIAVVTGLRAWLMYERQAILVLCGKSLVGLALVQLSLGLASLVVTGGATSARSDVPATEAVITTMHQAVGALLLAAAVALAAWNARLVKSQVGNEAIE